MKPTIALAILAAALSQPVQAEEQGPGRHMDRMQEELQLSDEQAAQVREIMQEQREKHRALFDEAADDREKVRAQKQALHEETKAKLGKVLNADQLARFDKMHEERMAKMDERRKDRMEFLDELQLSDEQKPRVRQILDEQRDKRRAIWETDGDKEQMRAKMQALHEETKTRLATVLNEKQLAQFEAAHEKRMEEHRGGGRRGKEGGTGAEIPAPQQP